jgi:hypothetical protein
MIKKLKQLFKPAVVSAVGLVMLGLAWLKLFAVPQLYMSIAASFVVVGSIYYLATQFGPTRKLINKHLR